VSRSTGRPVVRRQIAASRLATNVAAIVLLLPAVARGAAPAATASPADDRRAVAELDTRYQAAVKANDAAAMAAILDERFVLVLGNGTTASRADLLAEAKAGTYRWTHQEEEPGSQTVRCFGDTAVVTAKLWVAGSDGTHDFDHHVWFSDTYVRTPTGWRYAFGQASLALPPTP
jgi:ketosteroid isomerase-like protein